MLDCRACRWYQKAGKTGRKKYGKEANKLQPITEKSEFETSVLNAEIIDLNCRAVMTGGKTPKALTIFTAVFKTDNNEKITLNVPQEMYDGLEVGQKGELTLKEGELYSFVI